MNANLQKLLEGSVLNEETKTALVEAWEAKLTEARETIAAELREEFALRYENDKNTIVEATEKMVKDALQEEFNELAEDKKAIKELKMKLKEQNEKLAEKALGFIKDMVAEEIQEFRTERKQVSEGMGKLQKFVQTQLSEELKEFSHDRNELIRERVEFEKTKATKLKEARDQFIKSAAKVTEKVIRESLTAEIKQLREDINESKKAHFGKKLFEAFATEYMNSHYSEGSEVKKLTKVLESTKRQVQALSEQLKTKDRQLMEAKKEAKLREELLERNESLNKLLSPLNKDQRKIMQKLLESTPTQKLEENFKKYVGKVVNEDFRHDKRNVLNETTKIEYDGNRGQTSKLTESKEDDSVTRLKSLAGIK